MIIIHHNKDMDGYASGAICKLKYPDAKLIGWDYKDNIPDFEQFRGEDVIMIDITFPIDKVVELAQICKLTIIDHHISFYKDVVKLTDNFAAMMSFNYIYEDRVAACEIGWKHLFADKPVPYTITLIGRYDTWRQEEGDWQEETLPFKYYMYGQCNSAETFPISIFRDMSNEVERKVNIGKGIMKYQDMMDEAATRAFSFEREAYGGLKALILNIPYFNSETLKTKYTKEAYDIMIGFCFTGTKWSVSLRSDKPNVDVSVIAKARGGGGHKGAAGFEVKTFEEIFI